MVTDYRISAIVLHILLHSSVGWLQLDAEKHDTSISCKIFHQLVCSVTAALQGGELCDISPWFHQVSSGFQKSSDDNSTKGESICALRGQNSLCMQYNLQKKRENKCRNRFRNSVLTVWKSFKEKGAVHLRKKTPSLKSQCHLKRKYHKASIKFTFHVM